MSPSERSNTDGKSVNESLLTPPITPRSEKDVPFKPLDSDDTSLSMRKKHRGKQDFSRHHPQVRECVSSSDVLQQNNKIFNITLSRNKSMPTLHPGTLVPSHWSTVMSRNLYEQSGPSKPRRWTLPSKAGATKGLTTLKPFVRYHRTVNTLSTANSPAMITLRRASLKRAPQTHLTFFPPPTFSRTRSSFMTQFLKTMKMEEHDTSENMDFLTNEIARNASHRSPSIFVGTAQPTISVAAGPALTEVSPERLPVDMAAVQTRRYSTRYVSDSSTYEVLWNEQDSPDSVSRQSPPLFATSDMSSSSPLLIQRRASAAVDKLELQLSNAIAQSRRASCYQPQEEFTFRRQSFQSLINDKFSRLFNNTSLQNLPRSRSSKNSSYNYITTGIPAHHTIEPEIQVPMDQDTEFFPPLRQRSSTNTSCNTMEPQIDEGRKASIEMDRPRVGSMVGVSSHSRRRSITPQEHWNWRKSYVSASRSGLPGIRSAREAVDEEVMPLLSNQSE